MLMTRLLVCASFISLAFFSCKKENSASSKDRLKMIRVTQGDSVSYTSFLYDNQSRLITVLDSNNNGNKRRLNIFYNDQGRMWKVSEDGAGFYTFDFDRKGLITKKSLFHPGLQTSVLTNSYSYDGNGRLIADSFYSYWTKDVYSIVLYTYDQKNNVIESKTVDKNLITVLDEQRIYDNHPNALDGQTIMMHIFDDGGNNNLSLGKNNLLRQTFQDGTIVNYAYESNNNGLPKKCSFQDNTDPLVTYIDFYYE